MVVVDNDVVLKVACYSLHDEFLTATTISESPPALLGVGKYVVEGRIKRSRTLSNRDRAGASFDAILARAFMLEPDDEELALAADFETSAREKGLELDTGESQLLAIAINRRCCLMITGDKRAIRAIAVVCPEAVEKRIACLEQLIGQMVHLSGLPVVQAKVCSEPLADRAISICFGCSSGGTDAGNVLAGLHSYIRDLQNDAVGVLFPETNLETLAASA